MKKRLNFFININLKYCKGCGLCVFYCPAGVLKLSNKISTKTGLRYAILNSRNKCIECRQCVIVCPEAAIEALRKKG